MNLTTAVFEESVHNDGVCHAHEEQAVDQLCKIMNSTAHEEQAVDQLCKLMNSTAHEEQAVDQLCKLINSTAHEEADSNANCSPCIVRP